MSLTPLHINSLYETKTEPEIVCGFIKKEILGQGAFGVVSLVEDPDTGMKYAMKQFTSKPEEGLNKSIIKEMNLLASLSHPNIIKPHKLSINKCDVCCILNFMDSNLQKYIEDIHSKKTPTLDQILPVFIQVVAGIDFLHQNKIIHNDLKPGNILIKYSDDKGKIRAMVSDLDCIIYPQNNVIADSERTTLPYRAPEMLSVLMNMNFNTWNKFFKEHKFEYKYNGYFSNKIDIWALGCIFYELFEGSYIYTPENQVELSSNMVSIIHKYKLGLMTDESKKEYFDKIPARYTSLLLSMLDLIPEKRPTAREILYSLGAYPIPGLCSFNKSPVEFEYDFDETKNIAKVSYKIVSKIIDPRTPGFIDLLENVYKTTLQLLYRYKHSWTACLLIACKLFDIDVPLYILVCLSGNSVSQYSGTTSHGSEIEIAKTECDILQKLNFKLYYSDGNLDKEMDVLKQVIEDASKLEDKRRLK